MTAQIRNKNGFSLIELIIIIVITGILVSVVFVSYVGIRSKAHDASVLSDVDRIDTLESNYGIQNHTIGKSYDSIIGDGYDSDLDFSPSEGNVINVASDSIGYCIRGYNTSGTKNSMTNAFIKESIPGICDRLAAYNQVSCPAGFIEVPGSVTYGTEWFCVMKFEAQDNGGVAVSEAGRQPWGVINLANSATKSEEACASGCHLIKESEWMTIAQNVMLVPSNWTGGSVGSGTMYIGNSDSVSSRLAAGSDDSDGYFLTGNSPSSSPEQRRTLTLTNGEVIWDMAGNSYEWTEGTFSGGQPGVIGENGYYSKEWSGVTTEGSLAVNPFPRYTGVPGADTWTSANGIGKLHSNADDMTQRAHLRGGNFQSGIGAGVLALCLSDVGTEQYSTIGFRVAKTN